MALKILYISALPRDQYSLPVEGEYKAILNARKGSEYRNQIDIRDWPGVSIKEFQSVIQTFQPNVLHFSGHATEVGDLVFQGPEEESQKVPKDPFSIAFKLLGKSLKLVVLSACYSKEQAAKVVQYVDRVIGTDKEIQVDKAIMFSETLYESIGNGESVEKAFEIAENQISLNKKGGESIPNMTLLKSPLRDQSPLFLIESPRKQLMDYLDSIINEMSQSIGTVDFPIEHQPRYVENRHGTLISMKEHWNTDDITLEKGDKNKVTDAQDIIDEFLASEGTTYLVIAASFGAGKSTFVRKIAHDLAKRVEAGVEENNCVPILVSNTNAMDNYYNGKSVEELIQNIVAPYDNYKKILIIFDGVDECKDGSKAVIDRARSQFFRQYNRRKIILTTRLNSEFPDEYGAADKDTYLRLLPFTVQQANEFFKNLGTDLTYKKASEFRVSDEDIRKPLLAFLLSTVYRYNQHDLLRLREDKALNLTPNEYMAFIYLNIIHRLIQGKAKKRFALDEYREEKRILRRIAILMKLFRDNLPVNVILDKDSIFIKLFELDVNEPIARLKKILHDYFNIPLVDSSKSSGRRVFFLHSTFKEYLIAENYIEILLAAKDDDILNPYWINVSIPTKESMQFLEGLLGLIKKRGESKTISKWINMSDDNEGSLFNSFKYGDRIKDPLTDLVVNSSHIINDDTISLFIDDFNKFKDKTKHFVKGGDISFKTGGSYEHSYAKSKNTSINEYKHLWVHRWISLFVLNNISAPKTYIDKLDKEILVNLILSTGYIVPEYLKKLAGVKLDGVNLAGADLHGADLSGANLSGADLTSCNLKKAQLGDGVDLTRAKLIGANLSGADLTGAALIGANLSGANLTSIFLLSIPLRVTNLSGADLTRAKLIGANLSGANLSHVTLKKGTLLGADLSKANLSGADLTGAALIGANLSSADLTGAKLIGANLSGAYLPGIKSLGAIFRKCNLSRADLSGANANPSRGFMRFLITNASAATILSGVDFSGSYMSGIDLSYSELTNAILSDVNLSLADLSHADLSNANLSGANLFNADLTDVTGANFSGSVFKRKYGKLA